MRTGSIALRCWPNETPVIRFAESATLRLKKRREPEADGCAPASGVSRFPRMADSTSGEANERAAPEIQNATRGGVRVSARASYDQAERESAMLLCAHCCEYAVVTRAHTPAAAQRRAEATPGAPMFSIPWRLYPVGRVTAPLDWLGENASVTFCYCTTCPVSVCGTCTLARYAHSYVGHSSRVTVTVNRWLRPHRGMVLQCAHPLRLTPQRPRTTGVNQSHPSKASNAARAHPTYMVLLYISLVTAYSVERSGAIVAAHGSYPPAPSP